MDGGWRGESKPENPGEEKLLVPAPLRWTETGNCEKAGVDPAATWRPPAAGLCFQPPILSLQTSEEEEASFQDPEHDMSPGPPPHVSEELSLSKFIAV